MPRIPAIFARLRAEGRTALMPFLTAGDPSLEVTEAAIPVLEEAGASIVELGVPFSDPIADGPVIAASMHEALQRGVTPQDVFELVRRVRPKTAMGLVPMVSVSIVERIGPERFVGMAADAGCDGLIVPDLDVADAGRMLDLVDRHDLAFSLLVSPTTPPGRAAELVRRCRGFVYVLARVGITGERDAPPEVRTQVEMLRGMTDLPLAVGFGIARPEHVAAVTTVADAAIVGSALVRRMAQADDPVKAAGAFVRDLAGALACRTPAG